MSAQARAHESQRVDELFDAVVVGTGFGGAVAACRLAQAGKNVCVLERGRRYERGDFPRPAARPDHLPHTARWLWALDHGLFDVKDLRGTLAIQAAGYGGGSLVYANVHLRAPDEAFAPTTGRGLDAAGWPAAYSRKELDPYYDVVAAVLRVRPLPPAFAPSALVSAPLPKVTAAREAARTLGRDRWLFLPPLAIDFDACVMCGECVAGCQFHAKNTLDLNYLRAAERGGAEIRTLAEVVDVAEDADGYTVRYQDHISRTDARVRARSVFLCAGSVNSTHVLLRSATTLPDIPKGSRAQIGRRFFVNGDALAMVFDTAPAPVPTRGPTITTSLLYNGGPLDLTGARGDWFMVQDGGYPKWLEPVIGLFRGEFWLERNRIARTSSVRAVDERAAATDALQLAERAERTMRALLGVIDARRAFRDPSALVTSRLGLPAEDGGHPRPAGRALDDILPPQLRDLYDRARALARRLETEQAEAVSGRTLAEITRRVADQSWLFSLFAGPITRRIEPHRVPATLEVLHEYFLGAPKGTADPFTAAVLWPLAVAAARRLFLGRRPDDHAFLMLVMGVDAAPGHLYLDDGERLLAWWDRPANARLATMQERLMHDVATALDGEMRLNPDATSRQRPVTVHNLGGCAMADQPEDGVTDANGKVWGTRALYVLDGAAIPGTLGANPSATIAAIAERNVRKALEDTSSPIHTPEIVPLDPPLPGGPSLADIRRQLGQTSRVLDPIAGITDPAPPPQAPALGLRFEEVMQGSYRRSTPDLLPIGARLVATIDDLSAFLVDPRRPVTISGTVTLVPAPGQREIVYDAQGTLNLLRRVEASSALETLVAEGLERLGALTALRHLPARDQRRQDAEDRLEMLVSRLETQVHRYEMDYHLALRPHAGAGAGLRLEGVKTIHGGPGLAPWTQTTTLDVTIHAAAPPNASPIGEGRMHVHLADLLGTQLPSFAITGTNDPTRIAWALARFFRFFLGTLRQVYLPQLEMLDPLADRAP